MCYVFVYWWYNYKKFEKKNKREYKIIFDLSQNATLEDKEKIISIFDYLTNTYSDKITEHQNISGRESINLAEDLSDLKEVQQELTAQNLIKSSNYQGSKKEKKEHIELTEFISSDGFSILAGKNNKQNEFLLKIAAPEDIWLHSLNIPGSHVLIKVPQNNNEVSEAALHEGVYVAAYYSQARESSNVSVVYTRRKFVKKPSGSKPGFVIFTHEKTLVVNPDKTKLPTRQLIN